MGEKANWQRSRGFRHHCMLAPHGHPSREKTGCHSHSDRQATTRHSIDIIGSFFLSFIFQFHSNDDNLNDTEDLTSSLKISYLYVMHKAPVMFDARKTLVNATNYIDM